MSNLLESKIVRRIIWVLGGLIVIFLAFGAGIAVGYHRAGFTAGFANNYYRNFYGPKGIMGGVAGPVGGPMGMIIKGAAPTVVIHGIAGTVIDVRSSTIAVIDGQNNEQSVLVSPDTIIRLDNNNATIGDVVIGDHVAVIGSPTPEGQVDARFIRIFPASSTMPFMP